MTHQDRMQELETLAKDKTDTYYQEAVARALCEIARQLARIADAYEEANK